MRNFIQTLTSWLGNTDSTPAPKTRLHAEALEAREVPALVANFAWSMEDRFGRDDNFDGRVDIHNNPTFVQATEFNVTFNANPSFSTSGIGTSWQVRQNGALVKSLSGPVVTTKLPQGTFDVTATVVNAQNEVSIQTQQVKVRDLLIVSMGDSYAAGEGNPDIPRDKSPTGFAQWADSPGAATAHRSGKSGAAQAARALEDADPHTSVTFVSVARSGDGILDGIVFPRRFLMSEAHGKDEWSIPGYDAIDPETDGAKVSAAARFAADIADVFSVFEHPTIGTSQIADLVQIVGSREIDTLTISAGGNDAGFVPVLTEMLTNHFTSQAAIAANDKVIAFQKGIANLENDYKLLGTVIDSSLNVSKSNVYFCEYANPVLNDNGEAKGVALTDVNPLLGWSIQGEELVFGKQAHLDLNNAARDGAEHNGWRFVGGVAAATEKHGLASSNPFFNSGVPSRNTQGPFTTLGDAIVKAGQIYLSPLLPSAAAAVMAEAKYNPAAGLGAAVLAHLATLSNPGLAAATALASSELLDRISSNGIAHPNAAGWEAIGEAIRKGIAPGVGLDDTFDVYGTEGNDTIQVVPTTGTTWGVFVNGFPRAFGAYADVDKIAIQGGGGNDTIEVFAGGFVANHMSVYGGSGNDTFKLRDGKVIIVDGGLGTDTIDYSFATQGVYVNLGADKAATNATLVMGVENATGGSGNDILVGASGVNKLVGNGGRDLLIGGLAADFLDGGAGDDIVIDGATDDDGSRTALESTLSIWTTDTTPSGGAITRVAKQSFIRAIMTETDDGVVDTLGVMVDNDWVW